MHVNARYLNSLPAQRKVEILNAVATHYGVTATEIEGELTDPDAEALYEYLAFDRPMAMQVYRELEAWIAQEDADERAADALAMSATGW